MKTVLNSARRRWVGLIMALVVPLGAVTAALPLYIGTFTSRGTQTSEGIYVAEFDTDRGTIGKVRLAVRARDASFLAVDAARHRVYAISSVPEFGGRPGGAVSSYAMNPDGSLSLLNRQASEGLGPVHIVLTPDQRHVIVANFRGASLAVLPVNSDGTLAAASQTLNYEGRSIHPLRQTQAHPHALNFSLDGRLAVATLLGADECRLYRFAADTGRLAPTAQAVEKVPPGAGPRHFAFHPRLPVAYSVNELYSTVGIFAVDAPAGTLRFKAQIGTLPPNFTAGNTAAEVVVHPSGKFVYASNRGHDSIAVFSADTTTGALTVAGIVPSGGRLPRNFICDPTGRWLLVANQDSDNLVIFSINPETGGLTPHGAPVPVPTPSCLRLVRSDGAPANAF